MAKWDPERFWQNLELHSSLSTQGKSSDIVIWSEAALTVPYYIKPVLKTVLSSFVNDKQILLFGGVADNGKTGDDMEIYTSLIGLNKAGDKILEYHKSHLVPFG